MIQSAAIYVAVAWGAVEILITLQEKLFWPESISIWATRLLVVGFPVVVILAWRRDIESRAARFGLVALAFMTASVALWLTLSSAPVPRAPSATLPPVNQTIATVAILPFENGSGDPAHDYLARGFTGELIGRLSKHPDLAVIQEESAQSPFLASLISVAKAATLNADYLVQGRVLREEKFIEISASLQNLDGQVLWSEVLREPYSADGVIAMQRRISGEISRLLGTSLKAQAYCGETSDLEAMELYFRGRLKMGTRDFEAMLAGMELLKQAVDRDPYFGRAWSELGNAQLVVGSRLGDPLHPRHDAQQAGLLYSMSMSAMRRALDICPTIGGAYKILVPPYEGIDNESIDQELQWRDALAMDPNDAALLRQYAFHLMQHGMNKEAIVAMQRAYDIEPMIAMVPAQLAQVLSKAGRCEEAIALAEEGERLGGAPSASIEVYCARELGDRDALIAASRVMMAEGVSSPFEDMGMTVEDVSRARLSQDDPLRPALREQLRALWEEAPNYEANSNTHMIVYMATELGDLDLVFEILFSLVHPNGFRPFTIGWSPIFDATDGAATLRSDPRFVELIQKTNYPEYWREFGWPNGCEPDGESFSCF